MKELSPRVPVNLDTARDSASENARREVFTFSAQHGNVRIEHQASKGHSSHSMQSTHSFHQSHPVQPIDHRNHGNHGNHGDHGQHPQQKESLPDLQIGHNAYHLDRAGLAGKTIIVDPGHGGDNFGTLGDKHGAPEKVVTLQIAQKLKPILEKAGAKVILTRDHDQDVPVQARAALSQKTNADLFLSIHCNEGKAQGALSLYEQSDAVGKRSQAMLNLSQNFAEVMVDSLSRGTGAINKGAHPGSYAHVGSVCVLHHNTVPSTLVEVGFLNGPEGARLRNKDYQQKVADNLARGLQQYVSIKHSNKSF